MNKPLPQIATDKYRGRFDEIFKKKETVCDMCDGEGYVIRGDSSVECPECVEKRDIRGVWEPDRLDGMDR